MDNIRSLTANHSYSKLALNDTKYLQRHKCLTSHKLNFAIENYYGCSRWVTHITKH